MEATTEELFGQRESQLQLKLSFQRVKDKETRSFELGGEWTFMVIHRFVTDSQIHGTLLWERFSGPICRLRQKADSR